MVAEFDHFERFVASRTATGDALEEPHALGTKANVHVGGFRREVMPDGGSGWDSIGSGKGQMRGEGPWLECPTRVDEGRIDGRGERRQGSLAVTESEPQRAWPAMGRKDARPADREVERLRRRTCNADRLEGRRDPGIERRPDEAKRQMEPVEADPADVAAPARDTGGPDPIRQLWPVA